jgi:hypothetical protein
MTTIKQFITTSQGAYSLKKGETLLLPACVNQVVLEPSQKSELLDVYF